MAPDLCRLTDWMRDTGVAVSRIREAVPLAGGTQNLMYRLEFDGDGPSLILRHPPVHKREHSDSAILREARVVGALRSTSVPHPRLVAVCDDLEVLGSAFFLMEAVAGINPTVTLSRGYLANSDWMPVLADSVVDALAAIGAVDTDAVGLRDFGRPDGFLERQVDRWWKQLDSYQAVAAYEPLDPARFEEVAAGLRDSTPREWTPGLMHGDFHLANLICSVEAPRVAAVVDWELATVGDPLVDLGWLLATWPGATDTPRASAVRTRPHVPLPPTDRLLARYVDQSERPLESMDWYETLACYKLAVILEGTVARAHAGRAPAKIGSRMRAASADLLDKALDRVRDGTLRH